MRKIKSFLTIILFSVIICMTSSKYVFASTLSETDTNTYNFNTFIKNFPDEKKYLEENGYTEIVSEKNSYFKLELKKQKAKSTYEAENFYLKEVTPEEFFKAKLEYESNSAISTLSDNYFENLGGNNYLQLSVCVIRNASTPYRFTVNHNYSWLKEPTFNFQDVIGISVSPTMKINANSYKSQHISAALVVDPTSPTGTSYITDIFDSTEIKHNTAGVAAKFDMVLGSRIKSGYISCVVEFTQPNVGYQTANVFGNYVHTKIGFSGGISLDTQGKPSLGLNIIDEDFSVPVDVNYQP